MPSATNRANRSRRLRIGVLAALAVFELGAIALLHQLGSVAWLTIPWDKLTIWLELAPIEDVIGALLRWIGLVIAYWIAASTAAYALTKATRIPALVRAAAWATVPALRRVVDRAIAVAITTASLSAGASPVLAADIASQPPPPGKPIVYQLSDEGVPTPINPPQADSIAVVPPGVGGAGYRPSRTGDLQADGTDTRGEAAKTPPVEATVYEVIAGDNLWTISAAHLRAVLPGRAIEADEIALYWRRVIEVNGPQLRSGDPNLIYPGERIQLPAIEAGETK